MPSNHLILCRPLLLPPSIFPSIRSLQINQFFSSGGHIIGVSALKSVLPMNIQDWFPLGWTAWIKASILQHSAFFKVQLSHPYMTTGKPIALTRQNFVGKVMSLIFNNCKVMSLLSRLVITFLPRSKRLLISWLQLPSAVILEPKKNKVYHYFPFFPHIFAMKYGTRCHDPSFLNVGF